MDDVKHLRLSLPFITEDGKSTVREQTVSFKKIIKKDAPSFSNQNMPTYYMNMSLVIPNHIHAKIVGQLVPRKRSLGDEKGTQYPNDFPKTITGSSLESVTERFREVIYDYKWLIDLEKMELEKVIYYNFNGEIRDKRKSAWDGKRTGCSSQISYGYMVGYIGKNGDQKYRLNEDKKIINSRDGSSYKWKFVPHTDDRQMFFELIFNKFISLLNDLKGFEDSISEKTIDGIINSNHKLLM